MEREFYTRVYIQPYRGACMHLLVAALPGTPAAAQGERVPVPVPVPGQQSQPRRARRSGQTRAGPAQRGVHPPEPHAGHLPPRLVRSLRGKHGFSLGDASGQTDPHSSPLTPYSQHRSGIKPFCTNKPTSFQHPPPRPPKAFQDDMNRQVKGKHLGTALFMSIFLSILNPM